jgi:hypothetical protein
MRPGTNKGLHNGPEKVKELNAILRDWGNYFSLGPGCPHPDIGYAGGCATIRVGAPGTNNEQTSRGRTHESLGSCDKTQQTSDNLTGNDFHCFGVLS